MSTPSSTPPQIPLRLVGFAVVTLATAVALLVFLKVVMGPVLLAAAIGYLTNPILERWERLGVDRTLSVSFCVIVVIMGLVFTIWFLLPQLFGQLEMLSNTLPLFQKWVDGAIQPFVVKYTRFLQSEGTIREWHFQDLLVQGSRDPAEWLAARVGQGTRLLFSALLATLLTPMLVFFVLRDWRKLQHRFYSIVPSDIKGQVHRFLSHVDVTLRAVVRGQLLVICLLSILYAGGLFLAGLPAGLIVGLVTGVARLIPYLDVALGGALCFVILVTTEQPPAVVVSVVLVFLTIQLTDGLFLTPRIMGQFAGLHPVAIILAVLSFGDWFGIYGVLLAIPMAAVLRVSVHYVLESYKTSRYFRNGNT